MRISLTFRHLLPTPMILKFSVLHVTEEAPTSFHHHSSPLNQSESVDNIPSNDWLTRMMVEMDTLQPLLKEWNLSESDRIISIWDLEWNVFLQLLLENNFSLKLHIRKYNEYSGNELFPTKEGIIMTHLTFSYFLKHIHKLIFILLVIVSHPTISNSQLLSTRNLVIHNNYSFQGLMDFTLNQKVLNFFMIKFLDCWNQFMRLLTNLLNPCFYCNFLP